MKKYFLLTLSILFCSIGFSQNSLKEKLLEVYSESQTESIINNSQQRDYFHVIVFDSYRIRKIDTNKTKSPVYTKISTFKRKNKDGSFEEITPEELIKSIENNSFNILNYGLERSYDKTITYRLGETNYLFTLLSYQSISKL